MKFINDTNKEAPFYVGKCKNNTPPKHVLIAEGENAAEVKDITIIDAGVSTPAKMYKSKKSAEYIYLKVGDGEEARWLWIKDATAFDQVAFNQVAKEEKKPAEKKEKSSGKAAEVTLEAGKSYSINGTIMTGATANKRLGKKNVASSITQGKVFEVDEEGNQVGGILGATEDATQEATAGAEGDTGAA